MNALVFDIGAAAPKLEKIDGSHDGILALAERLGNTRVRTTGQWSIYNVPLNDEFEVEYNGMGATLGLPLHRSFNHRHHYVDYVHGPFLVWRRAGHHKSGLDITEDDVPEILRLLQAAP